jgi:RNA methyltransferase, RsmE family
MHVFYCPDIGGNRYSLNRYSLSENEARHCCGVLRLSVDDLIYLIDGKGGFYTAKIVGLSTKCCIVDIIDAKYNYEERNYKLHIAIAPTKNIDRFEWFLEKATEIGIDEITPIICEHSERQILKIERAEKIIIAAAKQSIKAFLPKINEAMSFKKFITQNFDCKKLIAHCDKGEKVLLQNSINSNENALILIGPEGDFSPTEIELARQNNFMEISLGSSRLRTETAGVHACSILEIVSHL